MGEIRGKITDAKTFSLLDYTTIVVKQDGIVKASTSSNECGDYSINNLPAGEYTLEVSYIGYTKCQVNGVLVKTGDITFWNLQLNINHQASFIDDGDFCGLRYIKLINETDNITTIKSKDILRLPMRD